MEQKIDLEIRLRELAAQSMLEARNEIDVLEVEKSLLTSDQRMNCYASLLEQQRKQLSNPSLSTDSGRGSKSGHHHHLSSRLSSGGTGGPGTTGSARAITPTRPDVIGDSGAVSASSPSFSSLSNSQSPSKLSPVSGESTNSPSSISSHHSRSGTHNHQHHLSDCSAIVTTGGGSGYGHQQQQQQQQHHLQQNHSQYHSNTLSAKQKAKNKRREQLMQSITSLSNINCNMVITNRASLSLSELRIPLMWRDVDHFKGRGDYKRYAIFCLLKIDSQIYDTQLISDVDRQVTDVTFDDLVVFNEIDHNFELTLEVYSCVYYEQFSLSSTPRKLKEKLTSSVSRAMGRRLATQTASAQYTKELQAYDKSYRFALIASAQMRLEDASDSVKTYDLVLVSPSAHNRNSSHTHYHQTLTGNNHHSTYSSSHYQSPTHLGQYHQGCLTSQANALMSNGKDANKNTLPLFGHFCCKLLVRPDVFDKCIKTGYLRVATISLPMADANISRHSADSLTTASDGGISPVPDIDSGLSSGSAAASKYKLAQLAASSKLATLSMSSASLHWGLLRNFALHLWPVNQAKLESALLRGEMPQLGASESDLRSPLVLSIDRYTRLLRVSNSSLTLETDKGCFVLGAYCPPNVEAPIASSGNHQPVASDDISQWLRAIEQLIYDSHIWGSVLNHYPPRTGTTNTTTGGWASSKSSKKQ